jgi:hypothetical protein
MYQTINAPQLYQLMHGFLTEYGSLFKLNLQ